MNDASTLVFEEGKNKYIGFFSYTKSSDTHFFVKRGVFGGGCGLGDLAAW